MYRFCVPDVANSLIQLFSNETACGATILSDDFGGAIASPRYPALYPVNQNCSWIIRAKEPCELHLSLLYTSIYHACVRMYCVAMFSVENNRQCVCFPWC